MSHDLDSDTIATSLSDERQGMTRRSVVRTGANLAWAVPAVSLITSAPALATSHGEPRLRIKSFRATGGRKQTTIAMGPVSNTGQGDAGQVTAVVELPNRLDNVKIRGNVSNGWEVAGSERGNTLTFVSTDAHLQPGEKTKALVFRVSHKKVRKPKGTASVTVTGNGASDSDSDKL